MLKNTAMEEKYNIEKLDGNNWGTWKFQMKHLLKSKGLWGFVDDSEVLATGTAAVKAEFENRSEKAFSTIILSINSSQLYLVTSCETPKDAWNSLRSHHERETLANKLFLKKRYFRAEMHDGASLNLHLKNMKEITEKLAAIGSPIAEEDQVVTLLGSLPKSYSTIVTALEARVEEASLSFVQQVLMNEEQKKSSGSSGEQKVLAVTQKKKPNLRKKFHCFNCGQEGHFKKDCPNKTKSDQSHKAKTTESEPDGLFIMEQGHNEGNRWLVDSGCTRHMTNCKDLNDYHEFEVPEKVGLGDGRTVESLGSGKVIMNMNTGNRAILHDVLYVPKLVCNLFSVRAATDMGNNVKFGRSECWITDKDGNLKGKGLLINRLYELDCCISMDCASLAHTNDMELWHRRLGHVHEQLITELDRKDLVKTPLRLREKKLPFCEDCVKGKMAKLPYRPVGEIRSSRKLELVHSDVCGPTQTESLGGKRYFVTFIDDFSRCCSTYFIRYKSEVLEKFKEFHAKATAECGEKIGTLRTDNGGEYVSNEMKTYLTKQGIQHQLTVPYSPEQNGVAERMNRTLIESSRSMLSHASLPNCYWAEAVSTASYIRNRMRTSSLEVTSYERWYGRKPDLTHMRVFGCMAYAHVPDSIRQKLDSKAEKFRFIGYNVGVKAYRLYDEETRKLVIRRNVKFNESDFNVSKAKEDVKSIVRVDLNPEISTQEDESMEVRRSDRVRSAPIRFGFDEHADIVEPHQHVDHMAYNVCQITEPRNMEEAMKGDQAKEWKAAANSEYRSLMENETWELVNLPEDRKLIGCRWVFKVKHGNDGRVERFKGRLVAQGFSQQYGIDYDETFSPVVRFSSIRTLLAFGVQNNMLIHQMDVETAFLNGKLDEVMYMRQPDGYVKQGEEHLVCKLNKSLYGLKQSPRCWNKVFHDHMEKTGFNRSTADPCVYIRNLDKLTIVAVYVDDLIILTETEEEIQEVKRSLSYQFKMKDMGRLHYCLGFNIEQDEDNKCIKIHQKQYIANMLMRYGLIEANTVTTPADPNVKLQKIDNESGKVDQVSYQSMVGSLLYAAVATRPDIAFAVGVVSKFNSEPTQTHLTAVKRILRYLKGTSDLGITYRKMKNEKLIGYSDADWAGDRDDRHSTSGVVFFMSGGPVSWLSKKQAVVALSTSEAEYIALSLATQEAIWLRGLINSIGSADNLPTMMYEDNQGAIGLAKNPIGHSRTKHIDIRYHYVREAIQDRSIELSYCASKKMIADICTKALPKGQFECLRSAMGMN